MPGAAVAIKNDATGVETKGRSDSAGRYIFNDLQPASYTLNVEAPGFSKLVQSGVVLRVSQQSVLGLDASSWSFEHQRGGNVECHSA